MTDSLLESIQRVHEHLEDVTDLCCLLLIGGSERTVVCVRALTELAAWHLDTEEEFLLPAFAVVEDSYPPSARCEHIRADHEKIGQQLEAIIGLEGVDLLRGLRRLHHLFEHHHAREALGLERFLSELDTETGGELQDRVWESFPLGLGEALDGATPVVAMLQEYAQPPAVSSDPAFAVEIAIHQAEGFAESILRHRPREEWFHHLLVLTGDVVLLHAEGLSDVRKQRLLKGQVRKLRALAWKVRQSVHAEREENLGGNGLLQAVDRADTACRVLKHIRRTLNGRAQTMRRRK